MLGTALAMCIEGLIAACRYEANVNMVSSAKKLRNCKKNVAGELQKAYLLT